jgi:hypothetical protein
MGRRSSRAIRVLGCRRLFCFAIERAQKGADLLQFQGSQIQRQEIGAIGGEGQGAADERDLPIARYMKLRTFSK